MPNRTRTLPDDDDNILPQIIGTVVAIATKSAESSTAAAMSVQSLEGKIDSAKKSAERNLSEILQLKAEVNSLRGDVVVLSSQITTLTESSNKGFPAALYEAIRNPQTLLILAGLVAAIFGLRLTLPTFQ